MLYVSWILETFVWFIFSDLVSLLASNYTWYILLLLNFTQKACRNHIWFVIFNWTTLILFLVFQRDSSCKIYAHYFFLAHNFIPLELLFLSYNVWYTVWKWDSKMKMVNNRMKENITKYVFKIHTHIYIYIYLK